MNRRDNIKRLMEDFRTLEASEENQRRRAKWECIPYTARDQWRGLPKTDGSCWDGVIPISTDLNNTFWSHFLDFSLVDYYKDPEIFLENYLKICINRFKMFDDDVFLEKKVRIWMASGFEASLLGMNVCYFEHEDPNTDYKAILKTEDDFAKLPEMDFYKNGMMPQAINLYEKVKELLDDDFEVLFNEWLRGPFGVYTYIRGYQEALLDMLFNEEFAHKVLRYITDTRIQWYDGLEKYLGRKVVKQNLFNDEINAPTMSPDLYDEFILPYETELGNHNGGIHYWHSCGNISRFYESLAKLPHIDMIHKSPWTETVPCAKAFGQMSGIEVCMNPQKDILEGTRETMESNVLNILHNLKAEKVKGFTLRANSIMMYKSLDYSIEHARTFIDAAKSAIDTVMREG